MPVPAAVLATKVWRTRLALAFGGIGAAAIGVMAGGLAVAMVMVRETPMWWRTVDLEDPATAELGRRVENGIAELLYRPRPAAAETGASDAWTARLRASEANAWLNTRAPGWITHNIGPFAWPNQLVEVQVDFDHGMVEIGAKLTLASEGGAQRSGSAGVTRADEQILSARLEPVLGEDGALWLEARRIRFGRLTLPASWAMNTGVSDAMGFEERVPDELRASEWLAQLVEVFAGRAPLALDPAVTLEDGRRVELVGLEAHDGSLLLTFRTRRARPGVATRDAP